MISPPPYFYRRSRNDLQTRKLCYSESQRDVEAELLSRVCSDVETVLQDLCREQLSRGSNKDERLISMHVGSGSTNDRHSLMSGSVSQMPNRIRT